MSIPLAPPVTLPRDTTLVYPTDPVDWTQNMDQGTTLSRNYGELGSGGNASGHWIVPGTGGERTFIIGNSLNTGPFGEAEDGRWWWEGRPGPGYDRHILIVNPDGGVWQGINWNENGWREEFLGEWVGQPHFWYASYFAPGVFWKPGHEHGTAFGLSLPAYARAVDGSSGCSGLLVADYQGADGLLTSGPYAGDRIVVPRWTDSYERNIALGGVCAQWAEDDATYGVIIGDRSGYADVTGPQNVVGEVPKPATSWVQSGLQWGDTNAHLYTVDMTDYYYATTEPPDPVGPSIVRSANSVVSFYL